MRKLQWSALIFAVLLVPAPSLWADDRADALAIVDEAIKAHGGAEALAKTQTLSRISTGTMYLFEKAIPCTEEVTMSLPDRLRIAAELDKRAKITLVLNGDKGWTSDGGVANPMAAVRIKEIADEAYVNWLTTLTPLKKDGFELKPLPETKVDGKAAVGVLVSSKGHEAAKLYFDKESHLLAKIEREGLQNGEKATIEYQYGSYKEVDGVKLPGKLVEFVNGKKALELKPTSYKLLTKVDDATFGKP
jgi:hypothetical protein